MALDGWFSIYKIFCRFGHDNKSFLPSKPCKENQLFLNLAHELTK